MEDVSVTESRKAIQSGFFGVEDALYIFDTEFYFVGGDPAHYDRCLREVVASVPRDMLRHKHIVADEIRRQRPR